MTTEPLPRSGPARRRVRVAHLVGQLDVGGMEKLLVEFGRWTDRERFALTYVCLSRRGAVAEEIESCGWPVVCMNVSHGLRLELVWSLAQLLRRLAVDVVHTHNNKALIYGGPAARLAGVPVVLQTRHGQSLTAGRRQRAAFRCASLLADRLLCVSRDSERLTARQGVSRRKLQTIHNGIDTGRFRFSGPQPGGPAVMVGRMVPVKGVEWLLQAVAIVVRDCPSFRLEIAGDGASLRDLRHLAESLKLGGNVRFLGLVHDVRALLARAAFFVLPSLSEGISLTLLEAMSCGLPIVATRVGGTPELVRDGQTGLLVAPQSPHELAAALSRLWRDSALRTRMGAESRRRVEEHFDVRRMVATYESLYLRLGRDRLMRRKRSVAQCAAAL